LANPQPDKFTRLSNEIMDAIAKAPLNGTQFRILMVVWRYTYGFNRKEAELSLSFLVQTIGVSMRNIRRELQALFDSNILVIVKEAGFNNPRQITFNKDYDTWNTHTGPDDPEGVNKRRPEGVNKRRRTGGQLAHQEIHSFKDNIKDNIYVVFTEWFNEIYGTKYKPKTYKDKINQRLKNYSLEQLKEACINMRASPYMMGQNDNKRVYATIEYITRNDTNVDKYLERNNGNGISQPDNEPAEKDWGAIPGAWSDDETDTSGPT